MNGEHIHSRGNSALLDELSNTVAILGSRSATSYGQQVAYDYAREAATLGHVVITGGGFGIEAAAIRGALAAHMTPPLIVQACGLNRGAYPTAHPQLFRAVTAAGGLIISLTDPDAHPTRTRFRDRDNWIATTATRVLLVEASTRSNSLARTHTARSSHHTRIGAVPGPVTSALSEGPNTLIGAGQAHMIHNLTSWIQFLTT